MIGRADRGPSQGAPVRIGLPRGHLFASSIGLLRDAGAAVATGSTGDPRLVIESDLWWLVTARSMDLILLIERGALDAAIVGSDVLFEAAAPLREVLDLSFGQCRLVVAAPPAVKLASIRRVATKYPRTARRFFEQRASAVDLVVMTGSTEAAPATGIADGIVDLVETGTTLRANGLVVIAEIAPCTARLVAPGRTELHPTIALLRDRLVTRLHGTQLGAGYAPVGRTADAASAAR